MFWDAIWARNQCSPETSSGSLSQPVIWTMNTTRRFKTWKAPARALALALAVGRFSIIYSRKPRTLRKWPVAHLVFFSSSFVVLQPTSVHQGGESKMRPPPFDPEVLKPMARPRFRGPHGPSDAHSTAKNGSSSSSSSSQPSNDGSTFHIEHDVMNVATDNDFKRKDRFDKLFEVRSFKTF